MAVNARSEPIGKSVGPSKEGAQIKKKNNLRIKPAKAKENVRKGNTRSIQRRSRKTEGTRRYPWSHLEFAAFGVL